jgi:hypothetical protein
MSIYFLLSPLGPWRLSVMEIADCAPAQSTGRSAMIVKRHRVKHEKTFQERLAEEAARFKELAEETPPGTQRELYLRRARQAETASDINDWLKSPGLQPPRHLGNLSRQEK